MRALLIFSCATACAAALSAQATPAQWPALLQDAMTAGADDTVYAYDMVFERQSEDADGAMRLTIDPAAAAGEQVQIVSAPDTEAAAKAKAELEKDLKGLSWCDDIEDSIDDPVALQSEDDASAVFTFTPLPDPDAEKREKKMFEKLIAELTIDKSTRQATGFRYYLPSPYKPAPVAKIKRFELVGVCETAPNGRPYVAEVTTSIEGSAVGNSFGETIVQRFENLR